MSAQGQQAPVARTGQQRPSYVKTDAVAAPPPARKLWWPAWKPETSLLAKIISVFLHVSFAAFIVFLILLAIHYTVYPIFSFSPNDNGIISLPTPSDKQVQFDKSPAGNDASSNFINIVPCGYTLSMDLYLTGAFIPQTNPRVILYSSPAPVTTNGANPVTNFPNSNILLWLDPVLNDLYLSAITKDGSGNTPPKMETTKPITNVGIRKPFRVTYVYNPDFVEVYINGSPQISMKLKHKPIGMSTSNPFWFGHISSRGSCMVGNVYYWNRILTSREVNAYGAPVSSTSFFGV